MTTQFQIQCTFKIMGYFANIYMQSNLHYFLCITAILEEIDMEKNLQNLT